MTLTTNQLILLLSIKRGTEEQEKNFGTYDADIKVLLSLMFITSPHPGTYRLTINGEGFVGNAKIAQVDPEINRARMMIGKQFRHKNGIEYTVIDATNLDTIRRKEHPISIVYLGRNGKTWSRLLSDWDRSFTLVEREDPKKYPTNEAQENDG